MGSSKNIKNKRDSPYENGRSNERGSAPENRSPAHTIRPHQLLAIEELEEKIRRLEEKLRSLNS